MIKHLFAIILFVALSVLVVVGAAPKRVSKIVEIPLIPHGNPCLGDPVMSYDESGRLSSICDMINNVLFFYGDSIIVVETDAEQDNMFWRRAIKKTGDKSLIFNHYGIYSNKLPNLSDFISDAACTTDIFNAGKLLYSISLTPTRLLENGSDGTFTGKITMNGGNITGYEYGNERYFRSGPTLDDLWVKYSITYTDDDYRATDYTFDFMTYVLKWHTEACTTPCPFDLYCVPNMSFISKYPSEFITTKGTRFCFSYDRSDSDCLRITIKVTEQDELIYNYILEVYFEKN